MGYFCCIIVDLAKRVISVRKFFVRNYKLREITEDVYRYVFQNTISDRGREVF